MSKKQPDRLPTSKPSQPYEGTVVTVKDIGEGLELAYGWQAVILVQHPAEFIDYVCTDPILIDSTDPATFAAATAKLATYGLDTKDMWAGSIPTLLEGRRIRFNYRATKPPKRMLPEVEVIKVLESD